MNRIKGLTKLFVDRISSTSVTSGGGVLLLSWDLNPTLVITKHTHESLSRQIKSYDKN